MTVVEPPLVLLCMWPLVVRLNFSGPSRRRTLPVPYRSFNLTVAGSTVCPWLVVLLLLFTADDDGFWNIGRRGVFTMLAQLTPIAREATPSERGERKAGLLERAEKSGLCERDDLVLKVIFNVRELLRSAT